LNVERFREQALALPHVTEDFPFDEHTLVFRVGGKIFALLPLEKRGSVNLKCDPERAIQLRERYSAIRPGYHMNKAAWNTLEFEELPSDLVVELLQHSYDLVWKGLTKKVRQSLEP
jgi:predicted DNA-binding protein (MmcQ/YjbR family)